MRGGGGGGVWVCNMDQEDQKATSSNEVYSDTAAQMQP